MKKKGFTLIELIVVIAIIGVLAAILVPAMLGYVKKSKITTANTTAKSIYNAFNSSLTDMDSEDVKIKNLNGYSALDEVALNGSGWDSVSKVSKSDANASTSAMFEMLKYKVNTYFSGRKLGQGSGRGSRRRAGRRGQGDGRQYFAGSRHEH